MTKIRQNRFYIASVFNIKEDGDKDRYQDVTQTWNKTKKIYMSKVCAKIILPEKVCELRQK